MAAMYRSSSLENEELMALFGGERDHYFVGDEDCASEEYELDSESSWEGRGGSGGSGSGGGGVCSAMSLEIYGLQREQQVYFSNREYYRRLEELKNAHQRNMAELERLYVSQGREWCGEGEDGGPGRGRNGKAQQSVSSLPARKLQRINSQEELDFHETSSGSDQSELCGEDSMVALEPDGRRRNPGRDQTFGREILLSPEGMTTQRRFRFTPKAPFPKPQTRLPLQTGSRVQSRSKVTVPRPFRMMLREEDRKRRKVRTRSEIELENTLLRRELEELKECQKKFRASPAPAHTHLPLYEIISRRPAQRSSQHGGDGGNCRGDRASPAASPRPFHFLERERRKKEARIVAELGSHGRREERRAFKARPMPSSVYGTQHGADPRAAGRQPLSLTVFALEREATEGQSDPNSDPETEGLQSKPGTSPDPRGPRRCPSSKPLKKQIELSIEMVKEREWPGAHPPESAACSICSPLQPSDPEPLASDKSGCISV